MGDAYSAPCLANRFSVGYTMMTGENVGQCQKNVLLVRFLLGSFCCILLFLFVEIAKCVWEGRMGGGLGMDRMPTTHGGVAGAPLLAHAPYVSFPPQPPTRY